MGKSCLRCRWLITRDTGYSNYTVEDTEAHCLMRRNPALPADVPDEVRKYKKIEGKGLERASWVYTWAAPSEDRWAATKNSRCELYQGGYTEAVGIDCEGEDIVSLEEGQRIMLEEGDPVPLLIAQYFSRD